MHQHTAIVELAANGMSMVDLMMVRDTCFMSTMGVFSNDPDLDPNGSVPHVATEDMLEVNEDMVVPMEDLEDAADLEFNCDSDFFRDDPGAEEVEEEGAGARSLSD